MLQKIGADELRFLQYVAGHYLFDNKLNETVKLELGICSIGITISEHRINWNGMEESAR